MTTDPEETRLQNALVHAMFEEDAAKESGDDDWWSSALDKRRQAFDALRDYRTKSPSPTPELLPCPLCEKPCILFTAGTNGDDCVIECADCNLVLTTLRDDDAVARWNARSPCTPPSRIEVSDRDLVDWWFENRKVITGNDEYWIAGVLRAALAHFSPTQPAPVQQEITDEEIMDIWWMNGGATAQSIDVVLKKFARTLLSKQPYQPITPAQWETIRKLAITEAPEVFAQEARDVLRGGK